jgi:hypothetical protein
VAKNEAREAFNVKESAAYIVELDAQVVEQGVLEASRAVTSLREKLHDKLRKELREEGFDTSGNEDDDDDLDIDELADIPTDEQAA